MRNSDQDEQAWFIDGTDDVPVYGHAGLAYPLYDSSHSTAGYLASAGTGHGRLPA